MLFAVGSQNPVKIACVRDAVAEFWPLAQVVGVSVTIANQSGPLVGPAIELQIRKTISSKNCTCAILTIILNMTVTPGLQQTDAPSWGGHLFSQIFSRGVIPFKWSATLLTIIDTEIAIIRV